MASKGPKAGGTKPVAAVKSAAKAVVKPAVKPAAPAVAPAVMPAPAVVPPAPAAPIVAAIADVATPMIETAQAVITPAADAVATIVQKETEKMATKFETPKFVGDINERAKTAFEKSGKLVEDMNEFTKGNIEAIVESSRITAKGFETIGQDAAEYGRKSFESLTALLKNMSTVKSPTEFLKLHNDYVRSSFDAAVAEASKSTEAMIKLAGDAAQPISNRFAVAAEKVKAAA